MPVTQYGTTLTFDGPTNLAALAGGALAIYDEGPGTLYVDTTGTLTAIANTGFQASDIEVLADGSYLLVRQTYPGQTQGGASYQVLAPDGSVRVGTADVASGTGHALGGPSAVATPGGGFLVAFTDYQDGTAPSIVTYPPYGDFRYTSYNAGQGTDVGYRFFDPSLGVSIPPTVSYSPGDFEIANTGTFSNSGASGSDRAGGQSLADTLALADGSIVTAYVDDRNFGIPEEQGGNVFIQDYITLRLVTPSGASGPIYANTDAAPLNRFLPEANAVTGRGGVQLVSLGQSGFAAIWHENDYVADASVYGGYAFNGTNTEIRYFDVNGNALTGEIALFHRGAELGNISPAVGATAFADGRIALIYETGVYGVNGSTAGQLNVAIVGQNGASLETTAITPAATQGIAYDAWHVQALSGGTFAAAYVGTMEGSVVKTFTTDFVTPCYCPGTRIATDAGETLVEDLRIGDRVATLHGGLKPIKWIGRRGYDGRFIAGRFLMLPVCIRAGALSEGLPRRDLWVSPGHALYLDGALVPAYQLINGVSVVQAAAVERVTYVHIELDEHDIILAEGCAAESFLDEGQRAQFGNAAEFAALYPADKALPISCARRLDHGFELQAIRERVAARAGLPGATATAGPVRGYVDKAGPDTVEGWAIDEDRPDVPVCLDILVDGRRVARALANMYRADVREAGIGSGLQGFSVGLLAGCGGVVEVRRSLDGAPLVMTAAAQGRGDKAA